MRKNVQPAAGLLAGLAITLGAFASPALAVPVIQTNAALSGYGLDLAAAVGASHAAGIFVNGSGANTHYSEYLANGGLVFSNNISGSEIHQVADVNERLLGQRVDALGKLSGNGFATLGNYSGDDVTVSAGALSLSCTSTDGKCTSFDWSFDQSFTNLSSAIDWNVISIGVKYGSVNAFFLIDPDTNGADSGSFNLFDFGPVPGTYATEQVTASDLLFSETMVYGQKKNGVCKTGSGPDCFVGYKYSIGGLSHVDFFGTVVPTSTTSQNVPEPASLALLTLGLAGLGIARKRRRA